MAADKLLLFKFLNKQSRDHMSNFLSDSLDNMVNMLLRSLFTSEFKGMLIYVSELPQPFRVEMP